MWRLILSSINQFLVSVYGFNKDRVFEGLLFNQVDIPFKKRRQLVPKMNVILKIAGQVNRFKLYKKVYIAIVFEI